MVLICLEVVNVVEVVDVEAIAHLLLAVWILSANISCGS
jgi:hypothetical protein